MYFFFRRILETLLSALALLLLSPLFLLIALAVKLDSKGPVFFLQERIGKGGKPYRMIKFRTMVVGAQQMGSGVYSFADDPRITRVGRFLRKTSLDELPQLVNILKGEMALVGPRSPVVGHFPQYHELSPAYRRRFSVLPGITGLAQITGRNELCWDDKVYYDNLYIDRVRRFGPFTDLKILILTVLRVFSMKDVSESNENRRKNEQALSEMTASEGTYQTEKEQTQ